MGKHNQFDGKHKSNKDTLCYACFNFNHNEQECQLDACRVCKKFHIGHRYCDCPNRTDEFQKPKSYHKNDDRIKPKRKRYDEDDDTNKRKKGNRNDNENKNKFGKKKDYNKNNKEKRKKIPKKKNKVF